MEQSADITTWFFLIFAGAAALATFALATRQPLIIAYIAVGAILGPHGVALIADDELISQMAEVGIIFLLFLLGLDMRPANLTNLLGKTLLVGGASTIVFMAIGATITWIAGYPLQTALLIGATCAFSSTIIGIKLLPTTALHHRHIGEVIVGLLLFQDLLAIGLLLVIDGDSHVVRVLIAAPILIVVAFLGVRWVILPLMQRFQVFHEFMFLLAIGWCLTVAIVAREVGLGLEIGAFLAGVALASHSISQYLAESLRPLRDFFLVLFFFSIGAGFDHSIARQILLPALILAVAMVIAKPVVFEVLLRFVGESKQAGREIGFRLGQTSEFSIMVAFVAAQHELIGVEASHIIQAVTVLTFLASTYIVILNYPSPIAISERLRRN